MKIILLVTLVSLNVFAGPGGGGGGPRMEKLIVQNIDSIRTNQNKFFNTSRLNLNNINLFDISEIYLKNGNVLSAKNDISNFLKFSEISVLK